MPTERELASSIFPKDPNPQAQWLQKVPSKFAWRTSPRKRLPPSARFSPKKSKRQLEESFTVSSDIASEADNTVSRETAEIVNTESQDS